MKEAASAADAPTTVSQKKAPPSTLTQKVNREVGEGGGGVGMKAGAGANDLEQET